MSPGINNLLVILSIATLKDENGRATCGNSGFEPSLFTIMVRRVGVYVLSFESQLDYHCLFSTTQLTKKRIMYVNLHW